MHGGRLAVVLPEGPLSIPQPWLPSALCTILDAAEHLATPPDIPRALADNARSEPLWLVRLNVLRTLAQEYPGHPATLDALRAAARDPSEEIQLGAGLELGEEGVPVLSQLAENASFDDFGARAVAALGKRLSREKAGAILSAANGHERPATAVACIDTLGRHGSPEDAPLLIEALSSDVADVRLGAAAALGVLGGVEAVLPLQEAAKRFGGLMPAAARHAIAAIQARLAGAVPGQVSLATDPGGILSLADERAGAVSVAPAARLLPRPD
jgi:HEAT repeat protein